MKINFIAAVVKGTRGIGYKGKLPWGKVPKDLKYFKNLTENNIVIMGRKTFDSIGKALPNRHNIILSRTLKYKKSKIGEYTYIQTNSIEEILGLSIKNVKNGKTHSSAYVIGGEEIYNEFLPYVNAVYLSEIYTLDNTWKEWKYDTFFPLIDNKKMLLSSTKVIQPIVGDNFQVKVRRYSITQT